MTEIFEVFGMGIMVIDRFFSLRGTIDLDFLIFVSLAVRLLLFRFIICVARVWCLYGMDHD